MIIGITTSIPRASFANFDLNLVISLQCRHATKKIIRHSKAECFSYHMMIYQSLFYLSKLACDTLYTDTHDQNTSIFGLITLTQKIVFMSYIYKFVSLIQLLFIHPSIHSIMKFVLLAFILLILLFFSLILSFFNDSVLYAIIY